MALGEGAPVAVTVTTETTGCVQSYRQPDCVETGLGIRADVLRQPTAYESAVLGGTCHSLDYIVRYSAILPPRHLGS